MIENKTTSDCSIYAFVGTAILAISLVVAMYVGNDFHQSLFVESIIFVGSNILLWAIFISMVNYPYELMTIGSNSKTKKNVVEAEPATEQEQPKQTLPQTESAQYSHEDYARCVEAQEKDPNSLLNYTRELIKLRKSSSALGNTGDIEVIHENYPLIYKRFSGDEAYIVVLNPSAKAVSVNIPKQGTTELVFGDKKQGTIKEGRTTDKVVAKGISALIFKIK